MCGILGIVAPEGRSVELADQRIVHMRDAMFRRGPDAAGLFRRQNVALAHRRLAIRDLEGGRQPLSSSDGQTVLVYNGELYNDAALRQELRDLGYHFRDQCDTEIVLAAYLHWGADCVQRLRGMFAFGIYDFRDQSLLLARDRFGVKPLYLSEVDGHLLFASSIGALLRHPSFDKQPNFAVISHYLTTLRLTLGRETVYEGIWQLMPGEMLSRKGGATTVTRYWEYPAEEEDHLDYDDAVQELHDHLADAISSRLVSDVPVGLFLSGGVDSNTLAHLLPEHPSRPGLGQCGGGDAENAEDFQHAEACAERVGMDFAAVRVSANRYYDSWHRLIDQNRLPLSTPSDVILYELALDMKKSVGVVLGGEGADELLCGYAIQHWSGRDFESSQKLAQGQWEYGSAAAEQFVQGMRKQYGREAFTSETDHYFALNSLIPSAARAQLWQPWAWQRAEQDQRMWSYYDRQFQQWDGMNALRKSARILHSINLEALLARLDSATMQASLEARVPFTDHGLVERMYRLPHAFKIRVADNESAPYLPSAQLQSRGTLESKRLLRSLADHLMPNDLARRQKASFPTPVQTWLSGPWQSWAAEQLRTSVFAQAIFEPGTLDELSANVPQAGMWLWPLLNISLWGDREFVEAN